MKVQKLAGVVEEQERGHKVVGVGLHTETNYTIPTCSHLDSAVHLWPCLFERTCAARKTTVLAAEMLSRFCWNEVSASRHIESMNTRRVGPFESA